MVRRRIWLGFGLVMAGAGALWATWRAASPHEKHPNVLIVLWDTVRADHLSLYGYDKPTTPWLERFAEEAVVYERAISPGMWTVPSHGSLFTGLSTSSHGAKVGWLWLDSHHLTLAEHFGEHGYDTFAWTSNPYLSDQTNLLQGFETVLYSWREPYAQRSAEATRLKLLPEDRSTEISPAWAPQGHGEGWPEHLVAFKDAGPVIASSFLEWVDQHQERPFFAYLNFLEAHHPRVPSMEARRAVSDEASIQRQLSTDMSLFRTMSAMEGHGSFTPEELDAMAAAYDATLWDLDRATAAITDGLAARGLLEDTIVVLVSDHGENLGENGMFDHRWDLHQTLVHVPLVVRWPKGVPAGRIPEPVSTAHLFGTLLSLTGLPAPSVAHPLPELGEDEQVFSELEAPTPRLPEIRSAWPDLVPDRWQRRFRAAFDDNYKLLRDSGGGGALYDLQADPHETLDLRPAQPELAEQLQQAMTEWDQGRPKYDPRRRTAHDKPGNPLKADPQQEQMLRQLGYTSEDEETP
jgi:arylsulfatase A-like enzyme